MGADRIKGITIEINGDTTKLTSALRGVNSSLNASQKALRDVNKMLKLDPTNTDLLRQKQDYLKKSVEDTEKKLQMEKDALEQLRNADGTEDTTEQQRALERQIADTEAQLKSLQGQLSDFGSVGAQKVAAVGEKFKEVGQKMQDVGNSLSKSVTAPILAIGGTSAKFAADFETSLAKVSTIADTTQVPMEKLQKQILNLSNETGVAATDIAENVYNAISAGQETGDAVNFVSNATKLAKAGFAETGDSLNILTTIMNAYGLAASEVGSVSDKLITIQNLGKTSVAELSANMGKVIPTANMYKVNLDNISAAYVATTKNGIGTAESTTYINGMLNELGKSGTTVSNILQEKTGKSFAELMESGYSLTDALAIIEEEAEASGKSIGDMFGSQEAAKAAAVLVQHTEDFTGALDAMSNSAGATQTAFDKMDSTNAANAAKTLNELKNTAADAGNSILTAFGPTMQKVGQTIKSACEWFTGLDERTKNVIVTVAALAAAVGPVLSIGGKVVSGVGTVLGLAPKLATAFSAVSGAVQAFGTAIAANPAGLIIAGIVAVVAALVLLWNNCEGFRNAVTTVFQAIKTAFDAVVQWFSGAVESIGNFFSGVKEGISNFGANVAEKFGAAKDAIVGAWDNVKSKTAEAWGNIKSKVEENGGGIKGVLVTAAQGYIGIWKGAFGVLDQVTGGKLSSALSTVQSKAEEIKTACSEKFNAAKDAVVGAWDNVKGKTAEAWGNIKAKVQENGGGIQGILVTAGQSYLSVWTGAFNAIDQVTGGRLSSALSTVQSKVEGIKAAFTEKLGAARDKVKEIIEKIKGFFNFTVKLPHIPLPHFSLSPPGWTLGDLVKGKIPSLSVNWYRKAYDNPIVFNRPTVIPTPEGLKGFGDGSGAEVVIGMNRLRQLVANAGGGDTINNYVSVYAAEGQSEDAIADKVIQKLTRQVNRKRFA